MAGGLEKWAAKRFKKSGGLRENTDLWIELRKLLQQHRVTVEWIRGHTGHRENEICDGLAALYRQTGRAEEASVLEQRAAAIRASSTSA